MRYAIGATVLLDLARMAAVAALRAREEGVREMWASVRDALRAMVSLDRIGVGGVLPVCTGSVAAVDGPEANP